MKQICQVCGGIIGRDCFNPSECRIIAAQEAIEFVPCSNCNQLKTEIEQLEAENKKLTDTLETVYQLAQTQTSDGIRCIINEIEAQKEGK